MPALPLWGLVIVLLGLLQPVSFKPPQCFLVLLPWFLMYVEYVPRPVPRGPRSVEKRGQAESSSGLSSAKKSRQSSTRPGTPVVACMLLGEHINTLCPFVVCFLL